MAWTVRYRFRISTPLNSDEMRLSLIVGGREAEISGEGSKPLKESFWLTLNIHNFESEDTAREFGHLAARSVLLAGIRRGIGIDIGENRTTTQYGKALTDAVAKDGQRLMPNVHGLFVYKREGNERFFHFAGTGTVLTNSSAFFDELAASFDETFGFDARNETALRLIALSKMAQHPLAEAALCISAVELLSSEPPWTAAQLELLASLREQASTSTKLHCDEAKEVADGVERVFKSIRQSIKRKMLALGLTETDWKSFDKVYSLRSGILHGSITGRDQHIELATKAREICGRIVEAAVKIQN